MVQEISSQDLVYLELGCRKYSRMKHFRIETVDYIKKSQYSFNFSYFIIIYSDIVYTFL